MTDRREMEAVAEAILFVANEPVSRAKLLEVFAEEERAEAEAALEAVLARYRERVDGGVMIDEVAGGLRLVSRPDLHGYLRRFFEVTGTNKLTMAALETLAIIAYRQPITGPEIQELRGVNSSGVVKTLLERRLVRIAGRKEVVGKPFLYATTREFLQHFGLRTLKELPPLDQFDELFGGDVEGGSSPAGPDSEEEILRQAAELEEAADDAADAAESAAVEAERDAAEQAAEEAEILAPAAASSEDAAAGDGEAAAGEAAAEPEPMDEAEPADEAPSTDEPDEPAANTEEVVTLESGR